MRRAILSSSSILAGVATLALFAPSPLEAQGQADQSKNGAITPFNGKNLEGWDGNPKFWSVEDGTITGQTTAENPTKGNTFLIWRGGTVGDFVLTLEYKLIGGNSGIQYRSREVPGQKWVMTGHQADFEAGDKYSGIHYEEKGRGILALRGQKTVVQDNGKPEVLETFADTKELQSHIKKEDWNTYKVTAKGQTFTHAINGHVTSIVIDKDDDKMVEEGLLALQLHAGPPMTVQFRNIRLKRLDGQKNEKPQSRLHIDAGGHVVIDGEKVPFDELSERVQKISDEIDEQLKRSTLSLVTVIAEPDASFQDIQRGGEQLRKAGLQDFAIYWAEAEPSNQPPAAEQSATKNILFIAGGPSHGYGTHEHRAGCLLLSNALENSDLPVKTKVIENGWPRDESVFKNIDALVIYADGGGKHPAIGHLDKLRELADRGVGIVCIHYAVEVPTGKPGETFLEAIGGYFEIDWSVNPHWTASFDNLPNHPITRGIEPFQIRDEWYYHMRFRDGMNGVTPILTDLPPGESLSRPDGPHSGNPAVRKAVADGQPQHVAWAYQRKGGGRGFGFTGGHYHWNWGHNEFRQLVLNAIAWTAHLEVPSQGVPVQTLTVADLEAHQDMSPPPDYNPQRIQAMLDQWNR